MTSFLSLMRREINRSIKMKTNQSQKNIFSLFDRIFLFYLLFDENLVIKEISEKLMQAGRIVKGELLVKYFSLQVPDLPLTYSNIKNNVDNSFILKLNENDLLFRAEMISLSNDVHVFIFFPVLKALGDLKKYRLKLTDFSPTDPTLELLFALNSQKAALLEFQQLTKKLKQEQLRLQALQKQNELILTSAGEGIYGLDNKGQTVFINPAAARMIGWNPDELIGLPQHDVLHHSRKDGSPYPREECPIYAAFKDGAVHYVDNEVFWRKDGSSFPVEYTSTPIRDKDELVGAVVVFNDISERKKLEGELGQQYKHLEERSQELEASNKELESFSYSVSHDLRAPLRHIAGFVNLLKENQAVRQDEESFRHINIIVEAADRMGQLIDDLLTYSRVGRLELEKKMVNANRLIDEVKAELTHEIKDRHINWKIADLPEVTADNTMLRQVFFNLIGNALKFTRPRKEAKIDIGCCTDKKNQYTFYIKDNGVGFDMQYVDKLFGVFQRLQNRKEFEGTGIGLANVKRIIDRHGGRVWAEGEVNHGATFYFTLPK